MSPDGRGLLVHEWLSKHGGSENVFGRLASAFPEADLLCLWSDREPRLEGRPVRQTWLARTPLRKHKAAALPLMPATWRNLRGGEYSWMLASSHLFAHHARLRANRHAVTKLAYVHTPARYIWSPELDLRGSGRAARAAAPVFKGIDRRRARELADVAANSDYVRRRIQRYWERDADVIHPPVDVERIQSVKDWGTRLDSSEAGLVDALPSQFLLGASRFIPYKRLDLVIDTAEELDVPAVIAGSGPLEGALRRRADASSVPVQIISHPSDELLFCLYQRAMAFVFPAVEDFGIMPVEAMATGTPVVVNAAGGAVESLGDGRAGRAFDEASPREIAERVRSVVALDRAAVREHARRFSNENFDDAIRGFVMRHVA
ncbi:glycosyltransferase [Naasia sp. SYSU D00948]|uniref:glycosyltransferase n=1 Tax=Naasia sp. SYSU D00948 TaxID=2817379 RepID=UPI001B30DC84|nr:glycosyltransferase [Naasia sp. SYSU D00948]